jgi:hypothetical protein
VPDLGNKMMVSEVKSEPTFSAEKPRELFQGDFEHGSAPIYDLMCDYDVSRDGQRFLMVQLAGPAAAIRAAPGLRVVLNWFPDLRRAAQGQR